jgi:hypothetical protein
MGREVRRVPANWEHPKLANGKYQPMHDASYEDRLDEWQAKKAKWESGEFPDYASVENRKLTYEEWSGEAPDPSYYMPQFLDEERTHYQMYESTSEGTPISPVMETPEELARWLADNNASAFAGQTASYEGWLRVCKGGYAPSMVMTGNVIQSGVDGLSEPRA